ncbi:MAG: hypothetical protein JF616_17490 [Fibrobacteres bacterium]|nr:hypothetical protein [Fibrobacterota bacterium]
MSPVSRFAFVFAGIIAFAAPSHSKGIRVRFLPNPPEDSVVSYQVMRADGLNLATVKVGQVSAAAARDTFDFADTTALKGRPYVYSIIGLDAGGGASAPSESTEVAQPFLALPDTLLGGAQGARFTLSIGANPLSGSAPLALSLEDSSRFSLRYDSAAGQIVFAPRGAARSGQVVLHATYFGKFTDQGSVWISLETTALRPSPRTEGGIWAVPSAWSLRQGVLRIRGAAGSAGSATAANWSLWTADGGTVAVLPLPGDGSEAAWDGRDGSGRPVKPAAYLWAARGPGGTLLRSGSLRILP